MITPLTIKILTKKLKRLTVAEVQWLLRLYVHQYSDFCVIDTSEYIYAATSKTMGDDCSWISPDNPAALVQIRFDGGPAGVDTACTYYEGSFITFAIDRILLSHQTMGISYAWLIRFDGNSNRPIWAQLDDRIPEQLEGNSRPPKQDVVFKQKMLFSDYCDDPVSEYVQIGGKIIPIHESGSQGWDGKVHTWSSGGHTRVNM